MRLISKFANYKNFEFSIIIFFIFLISISISNVLNRVYFSEKIDNDLELIPKYKVYHNTLKSISLELQSYKSQYNCEVLNNLDERHRLRWLSKITWQKLYNLKVYFFGETSLVFQLHKIIIGFLIFFSYLSIILLCKKDETKNIIFLLSTIFAFFFLLISTSSISEINYSVVELLFLSLAFYAMFKEKNYLFLIICVLAPLNRESGFILPIIYLIFFPKNIKFFSIVTILSATVYVILNLSTIKCLFVPGFLFTTQPNYLTFSEFSLFEQVKIIIQDYLFYLIILFLFWNNTSLQKKFLTIFVIYTIVFMIGTPFQHSIIRILYLPTLMLYVYSGLSNSLRLKINVK